MTVRSRNSSGAQIVSKDGIYTSGCMISDPASSNQIMDFVLSSLSFQLQSECWLWVETDGMLLMEDVSLSNSIVNDLTYLRGSYVQLSSVQFYAVDFCGSLSFEAQISLLLSSVEFSHCSSCGHLVYLEFNGEITIMNSHIADCIAG